MGDGCDIEPYDWALDGVDGKGGCNVAAGAWLLGDGLRGDSASSSAEMSAAVRSELRIKISNSSASCSRRDSERCSVEADIRVGYAETLADRRDEAIVRQKEEGTSI